MRSLWVWGIIFVLSLILAVGSSIGYNYWYTNHVIHNECSALDLLIQTPVPKPADPKANPSREATYLFYVALKEWRDKDECS